jgi:thymidylate kinase
MHELLLSVFRKMEFANIRYCLVRDYDQLTHMSEGGEIDLLVQNGQLPQLSGLLAQLGFAGLETWGYAPHHFFLAYHKKSDCWLKLDVVTEVAYGKPVHALRTSLADNCLSRRRRCGPTFIPSPEDELMTLLLHCVLDKGYIAPARGRRLQALCRQVTEEHYLAALVALYWSPATSWPELAARIEAGKWPALLAQGETVAARLAAHNKLGTVGRQIRDRVLRKANRWSGWLRPRARTVALLAPDGAGKSTLAAGIQNSFYFPVRSVYMGLYQKNGQVSAGSGIKRLGFIGRLLVQWQRYLMARYHQARGRFVIFDRYSYDALLPPPQPLSWSKQWRRWLLAHACPAPDLVLVLDAPGEVLYARKGEHSIDSLEEQRQRYLQLKKHLPQMMVVDATRDAEQMRREVTSLIWRSHAR